MPDLYHITIAANFTIEPIEHTLKEALGNLPVPTSVEMAPYNQLFQQLLDPDSAVNRNAKGINVLFLRVQDLVKRSSDNLVTRSELERTESLANELVQTIKDRKTSSPIHLFLTPSSRLLEEQLTEELNRIEADLSMRLVGDPNIVITRAPDLLKRYSVEHHDNPKGFELGHIPYSQELYDAFAWEVCRQVDLNTRAPFKVLALDCDNTLWDGVCGEDGIHGVKVSEPRRYLQSLAVRLSEAGMLIALCSKNNDADVWELFAARNDMVLTKDHVTASKINWEPKSRNLSALASELNLGLESFIFVDDDPVVCSEVRTNCPEALTIELPPDVNEIPRLFEHLWCFDQRRTTTEDALRARSYQHQSERESLRATAEDLASFIESLDVRCTIQEMSEEQVARVSQLSLRTNQFNSTTIRRSEAEVREIAAHIDRNIWTVTVSDRFGDYGLVGVVTFLEIGRSLTVDAFMLSCRVLGRGVEYEILRSLGRRATELGASEINIEYRHSAKNAPILSFLKSLEPASSTQLTSETQFFAIAARDAITIVPAKETQPSASVEMIPTVAVAGSSTSLHRTPYIELASHLAKGVRTRSPIKSRDRAFLKTPYAEPATDTESALVSLWEGLLGVAPIGTQDDFFELGGDSLVGVTLFVEIENSFGKELPLTELIASPTIAKLAAAIDHRSERHASEYLVPINRDGTQIPLYCMHAAGGNVLFYRDLASELGPDQPVFGLQARGVADKSKTAHDNIPEMAAAYLAEIRSQSPHGPYRLCGSSFGGLVAFEAAKQLVAAGERVDFLGLFDTYAPGYLGASKAQPAASFGAGRIRGLVKQLRAIGSFHDQLSFIQEKLVKARMRVKRRRLARKNQFEIEYAKKTGLELPADILRNHKAIDKARLTYRPNPYQGEVVLFRAQDQPYGNDEFLGWGTFVHGNIVTRVVPGSHGALTVFPFASDLARAVSPFLIDQRGETDRSSIRSAQIGAPAYQTAQG